MSDWTPSERRMIAKFDALPPEGKTAVLAEAWRLVLAMLGPAVDDAHQAEAARCIARDLVRRGVCQGAGEGEE